MSEQYDITINGKFSPSGGESLQSPIHSSYIRGQDESHLPKIKPFRSKRQKSLQSMGAQQYISDILGSDRKKSYKIIRVKDNSQRKSIGHTKQFKRQHIDLRKKEKKGCGKINCNICGTDNKKHNSSHRKRRIASQPEQNSYNYAERAVISRALETHKKSNKRRVTHVQQLNEHGKFRLVPITYQEPKSKRMIEFEERQMPEELGRTYFQEMKINGKVYLVKKKKKRISEFEEEIRFKNSRRRVNSNNLLFLSQADRDQEAEISPYRVQSSNFNYSNQEIIRAIQIQKWKQKQEKAQKEEKIRKMKQWERNEERYKLWRDELNQKTRLCIHQQTYYQNSGRIKQKQQDISPKRMPLNRQSYIGDSQSNILSRNQSQDKIKLKKSALDKGNTQRKGEQKNNRYAEIEPYQIQFPHVSDINQSIQNYKPLTKKIDVFAMKKQPNFIREYSDTPGQEFLYFGFFNNKQKFKEGLGVLCTKKRVLEGTWRKGEIIEGAELKSNGVYKGTFVSGLKHGQGSYQWINGQKYIGEWKQGRRHGKGQWRSKNGQIYVGDWKNGKATGQGELITNQDGTYKGQFKDFVKHGLGKHLLPNGDIYIGDFWEGVPSGQGKYMWKNGLVYEGQFNDAVREGKGILALEGIFELDGDFKNDLPHGICRCKLENGQTFTGKYSYGDRSGFGNYENSQMQQSKVSPVSYWVKNSLTQQYTPEGQQFRI